GRDSTRRQYHLIHEAQVVRTRQRADATDHLHERTARSALRRLRRRAVPGAERRPRADARDRARPRAGPVLDVRQARPRPCGCGGGRRDSNNNPVPVWLIVLAVSIVTYLISYILIRTISRYREYAADRGSALITGAPENLMSALNKIASGITQIPQQDLREVAGMNAFFIVPTNWRQHVGELFMDHPPLEKRIAALSQIAREMGKPVAA